MVNAALALDRRVAVNLNYTVSSEVMNDCLAQCGIRHVLTSRRVMERFNLKLNAELIYLEDLLGKVTLGDKLRAAAAAWLAPVGVAGASARADRSRRRRSADDYLHLRLDRPAQGRDAHPSQRRLERRRHRRHHPSWRERRVAGRAAVFPLLRLHRDAVDGLDDAAEGHLPFQPAGGAGGRQALPPARRDHHDYHAHVRPLVPAALRAGGFREAGSGLHGRGEACPGSGRRLRAEIRRASGGRLRRHGAFARGLGQHSPRPRHRQTADGHQGGHGRPTLARHFRQGGRSRHGRGPGAEPLGHVAGHRSQRDERLLRPARSDGRGHPRRAGTSPATWP